MNLEQKNHWLSVMAEHAAADRIVQGAWLRDKDDAGLFRGCFFGCAMQTDNNPMQRAAVEMGLPEWLVRLAERIFEGLPADEARSWPLQFLNAIPVDTDLGPVLHATAIKRVDRLIALHADYTEYGLLEALKQVRDYHVNPIDDAARSAESARSAAWSAESAASAAWSAAWSAESAAWSAESAESAAWQNERDSLIEILTNLQ